MLMIDMIQDMLDVYCTLQVCRYMQDALQDIFLTLNYSYCTSKLQDIFLTLNYSHCTSKLPRWKWLTLTLCQLLCLKATIRFLFWAFLLHWVEWLPTPWKGIWTIIPKYECSSDMTLMIIKTDGWLIFAKTLVELVSKELILGSWNCPGKCKRINTS